MGVNTKRKKLEKAMEFTEKSWNSIKKNTRKDKIASR